MTELVLTGGCKSNQNFQKVCRLCLSEESLEDIFEQNDLSILISDLLSIVVSESDKMSHWICVLCRIRMQEFRDYQSQCMEVQEVLLSESNVIENISIISLDDPNEEISEEYSFWMEKYEDTEEDRDDVYNISLITADPPLESVHISESPTQDLMTETRIYKGKYTGKHIKCNRCGKVVQKMRFDSHMNGHLGLKPYKCERGCKEDDETAHFACKYKRQEHYRKVHDGFKYTCGFCGRPYGTRQGLFSHKQRHPNCSTQSQN
nr:hypermethylated in cancer 2 protein-like [Aedes albopictus]